MCLKNPGSVVSAVFLTPTAGPALWAGVMLVGLWRRVCSTCTCMVVTCQHRVLSRTEVSAGPWHMLHAHFCRAGTNLFTEEAVIS